MKIKEIAAATNISEGRIRNVLATPEIGEIFTKNFINIKGLKRYLISKFGQEEIEKRLGIKIEDLTVEKGERKTSNASIEIEDLEVNTEYVLKNYHFETLARFVGKTEVNGIELWIFKTDKGYKAYADEDLNNGHFRITEYVAE